MGREVRGIPEAPALTEEEPPLEVPEASSIGAYLRTQRRLRGLGLEELEAVTRIPRRSLERLEAGEYDAQPDGFARGFVRTVAGALGLDPDEAVGRMLAEPGPAPPRERGPSLRRAGLALAAAAALGAAVLLWSALRPAPTGIAPPGEPLPVRRDAVRALAEAVRAGGGVPAAGGDARAAGEGGAAPAPGEGVPAAPGGPPGAD